MPKTVALPLQSNLFAPEISGKMGNRGMPFALKLGRGSAACAGPNCNAYSRYLGGEGTRRPLSKHYVHSGVRRTVHPG